MLIHKSKWAVMILCVMAVLLMTAAAMAEGLATGTDLDSLNLTVAVKDKKTIQKTPDGFMVTVSKSKAAIPFQWSKIDGASYDVSVTHTETEKDDAGKTIEKKVTDYSDTVSGTSVSVSLKVKIAYTVTVTARRDHAVVCTETIKIQLMQMNIKKPNQAGQKQQGFTVTPGKALTNNHTSGDMSMKSYTTVDVDEIKTGKMSKLTIDGVKLAVSLADGSKFTAAVNKKVITLTPVEDAEAVWSISMTALKLLNESGVESLKLKINADKTKKISTGLTLEGTVYGKLRSAGYTNQDFILTITDEGMNVTVDGTVYGYQNGILTEE